MVEACPCIWAQLVAMIPRPWAFPNLSLLRPALTFAAQAAGWRLPLLCTHAIPRRLAEC